MINGTDMNGYMVKDAQRAIAWYRDVLDLEPSLVYGHGGGAEYELPDGSTFGLWGGGSNIPFQPGNTALLNVDSVADAVAKVKERGATVAMELDLPNCTMAGVIDSEGNTVFLHKRKS